MWIFGRHTLSRQVRGYVRDVLHPSWHHLTDDLVADAVEIAGSDDPVSLADLRHIMAEATRSDG